MGRFIVHLGGREMTLPNILHHEGVAVLLRRMFPPASAPPIFHMGLSGLNLDPPEYRPNEPGGYFAPETTLALIAGNGNDSGGYSARHRELLGLAHEPVTFTATMRGGACFIATPWRTFTNAIPWTPTPDSWYESQDPPLTPPARYHNRHWEPDHGWPWSLPKVDSRHYLRQDPETPEPLADTIAANLMRACSLPIGAIYIATENELIASAIVAGLPHGVQVRPGQTLRARYEGQLFP